MSAVLTAAAKRVALRTGFVSRPAADRFSKRSVPLGGGVALFASILAFVSAAVWIVWSAAERSHPAGVGSSGLPAARETAALLGGAAAMFVMGLADDKRGLGAGTKLLLQSTVAFAAAFAGDIRVEFFIESRLVTSILSALWIVVIINAFNFLDNMDGLACGVGAIVSIALLAAAAQSGQVYVCYLAASFAGVLVGFLLFNFPPAGIFMGDAGSLTLGFFLAALTLRTTYYHEAHSGRWHAVFLPVVVMAVPLYDSASVVLLRLLQGRNPLIGDTQHFSHRIQRRGLSQRQTVLTLYLATLASSAGAVLLPQVNLGGAVLIFIQTFMILAIVAILEGTSANAST